MDREKRHEQQSPRDLGIRVRGSSKPLNVESDARAGCTLNTNTAIVLDSHIARTTTTYQVARQALESIKLIENSDPQVVSDEMGRAFDNAHASVRAKTPRSSVSATALKVVDNDSGRFAVIESIGLTRAYLLRDGALQLLTMDDGVQIIEMQEDGESRTVRECVIDAMDAVQTDEDLHAFEAETFGALTGTHFWAKRHTVTRALGKESDLGSQPIIVPLIAGDKLLITDMGVNNLSRDEIAQALSSADAANTVVRRANDVMKEGRSARCDTRDINAVVIDINARVLERTLHGGDDFVVDYVGNPVVMDLPGGLQMEIGLSADLHIPCGPEDSTRIAMVHRPSWDQSGGEQGLFWLDDYQFFGHEEGSPQWHVHKGGMNSHVRVSTDGKTITFKDLSTKEGTKVSYTSLR